MHDDDVIKLDMWLVVEELRAHQEMMAWGMVFGVVVSEVGASGATVNLELTLTSAISVPVEEHFNFLRPFLRYGIVCKSYCCGVI